MGALVSIITPAFNAEKFIANSVQSVKNQTHIDWEMIIVDDCSTDKTVSIIQDFARNDSRIKLVCLAKNSGTGVARSIAMQQIKGQFVAFLDADDLWKPNKLSVQLAFMKQHQLPFTFCFYECINEAGLSLHKTIKSPKKLSYRQLFFCNYIGNLTAIYKRSFFENITVSSIRKRQDWMLWLFILKKIKTAKPVPESLAFYRIRENSLSASKINLLQHNFNVYRLFHQYNWFISGVCMLGFLFTQLLVKPFYVARK